MKKIAIFLFELSTFLLANGENKDGEAHVTRPPIKCFTCDGVSSPDDCHKEIECAEDEICYLEKYIDRVDIEITKYKGGCRTKAVCHTTDCLRQAGLKRRAGHVMIDCVKCCDTSFCNLELCGFSKTYNLNNMLRCYNCPNSKDPAHCGDTAICPQNQECITFSFVSVQQGNVYFQQKCFSSSQCNVANNKRSRHLVRSNGDIMVASSCCNETLCNDYNPISGKHVTNDIDYDVHDSYICAATSTSTTTTSKTTSTTALVHNTTTRTTFVPKTTTAALTTRTTPVTVSAATTVINTTRVTFVTVKTTTDSLSTSKSPLLAKSTSTTPTADEQTTRSKTTPTVSTTVNLPTTMARFSNMSCYICSGPAFLCDSTKAVYSCNSFEQQFCINTVTNVDISTRIVTRGCATGAQCKTYGDLNSPQCQNFDPSKHDSEKYTCTFCCNRPNCNDDVVPANVVQFPVIGRK